MYVCISYCYHINCNYCSITLLDCVMQLGIINWRRLSNMSSLEWMLMEEIGLVNTYFILLYVVFDNVY